MTGTCFLCGNWETVERHHLFGGPYRPKADKLGLTVNLCPWCHRIDPDSAHRSGRTMRYLHQVGQRMAMEKMGWSREDFIREFERNYLDEDELREIEDETGGRPDQGIGPYAGEGNAEVCVIGFQLIEAGVELPW